MEPSGGFIAQCSPLSEPLCAGRQAQAQWRTLRGRSSGRTPCVVLAMADSDSSDIDILSTVVRLRHNCSGPVAPTVTGPVAFAPAAEEPRLPSRLDLQKLSGQMT